MKRSFANASASRPDLEELRPRRALRKNQRQQRKQLRKLKRGRHHFPLMPKQDWVPIATTDTPKAGHSFNGVPYSITSIGSQDAIREAVEGTHVEQGFVEGNQAKQERTNVGNPYVHDAEATYDEQAQERFLRSLLEMQLQTLSFAALSQLVRQVLLRSGYSSVRSCGEGAIRKAKVEGGVDLLAFAHTDLTTSLTAIQIKQHHHSLPRRFVDELRGAMLRLRAEQGVIITPSTFSTLAQDASREPGLSPVRLLDARALTNLLMDYRLGLRAVLVPGSPQRNRTEATESREVTRWVFDEHFFRELEEQAKVVDDSSPGA